MSLLHLRVLAITLFVILIGVLLALRWADDPQTSDHNLAGSAPSRPVAQAIATTGIEAGHAILNRSPFAESRGPFSREVELVAVVAAPSIRLVSIRRSAGELTALLLIDGVEVSAVAGDQLSAGPVSEMSGTGVRIGERWYDLFADDRDPT